MLATIAAAGPGADALGFLLHKHPERVRTVSLAFGTAHVFYPIADPEHVQAALLVEVDPVTLSRRKGAPSGSLQPYVNDRPYTASSLLSVALNKLFGTALAGNCDAHPELVDAQLDLSIEVPVISGSPAEVDQLFAPLGWSVSATTIAPADDGYVAMRLEGRHTVRDALAHLYVLLPVLDGQKHYWVDEAETDKLLRRGGDWLGTHPERERIVRRYLKFRSFAVDALERFDPGPADAVDRQDAVEAGAISEASVERPIRLNEARTEAVMAAVRATNESRVIDLGCGEGRLLEHLMGEASIGRIVGVDVAMASLRRAERRLKLDELSPRERERIELMQGALTYRDDRFTGFGVATVIEVIEHLDVERLDAFELALFGFARPAHVIITTPNVEHNVHFAGLAPGALRHDDHRFEWTRAEFTAWCRGVHERSGYRFELSGIGPDDTTTGPPTQMAVFTR